MKRFSFRLQRLLQLASQEERAIQSELAAAHDRYEAALGRLNDARDACDAARDSILTREQEGLSADELTLEYLFLERAERAAEEAAQQVDAVRAEVDAIRARLWEVRKERRSLETLRDRRLAEHRRAEAAEEQAFLDELAAHRRGAAPA